MKDEWLPTPRAAEMVGSKTVAGFRAWVRRWNLTHPDAPIEHLSGRVESASLERALKQAAEERRARIAQARAKRTVSAGVR